MAEIVALDFAGDRRPWAHHAHIPTQHIEKLGQFVQGVFTQKVTEPCDAGIIADLEEHSVALVHVQNLVPAKFCICNHGTELHTAEDAPLFSDPVGAIKDGPGRIEHNADRDGRNQGRQDEKRDR